MNSSSSSTACETVSVRLGDRAYDILIGPGLLPSAGNLIVERFGKRNIFTVTDSNVQEHQGARFDSALSAAGLMAKKIVLPAGEETKSFASLEAVIDQVLGSGVERGDLLIAFGGGVVGDLAGFAAAIARRGISFVQIPTSLLAQVDSSVGGKTGINTSRGKNLVGAFHQPALVIADTDMLDTLPAREIRAGYAEVVKYGLIGDASFFGWLEENGASLIAGDDLARMHAIRTSCEAKADYVARDEKEHGVRALLNLGHTFGHALETHCGYDGRLIHGEAVAIGMVLAAEFSAELDYCDTAIPQRIKSHLANVGLPTQIDDIPDLQPANDDLVNLMQQDKKVRDGELVFVLLKDIGEAFVATGIDRNALNSFLQTRCAT